MNKQKKALVALSAVSSTLYVLDQAHFVKTTEPTNRAVKVKSSVVGVVTVMTVLSWYLKGKKKASVNQSGTTNSTTTEQYDSRYFVQFPTKRGILNIKDKEKSSIASNLASIAQRARDAKQKKQEEEDRTYSGPVNGPEVLERIVLQGQAKVDHLLRGRGYPREQIVRLIDEFVDTKGFDVKSYLDVNTLRDVKTDLHEYLYERA